MTNPTTKESEDPRVAIFFKKEWEEIRNNGGTATYQRLLKDDEIVIEFDFPEKMNNQNARKLGLNLINKTEKRLADKYHYEIWDHGGKSPHLHIKNIKGLAELEKDVRLAYKAVFCKKYSADFERTDKGYYSKERVLIQKENTPHWKKDLYDKPYHNKELSREEFPKTENLLEDELLNNAYKRAEEKQKQLTDGPQAFSSSFLKLGQAGDFWKKQPYFYDKNKLWWFWNLEEHSWQEIDETDLLNQINEFCKINTINSKEKGEIIESLKQVGRKKIPLPPKKTWIQFKNKIFDTKTMEIIEADHSYFNCNSIPYNIGDQIETPTIDKLMKEWVGEKYVPTLKEIIAYCCLPNYPIHIIIALCGIGRNGKTSFLNLLTNFLGIKNIENSELESLTDSRFETFRLYKKLACILGETNFGIINKTSRLKRLVGQDLIGYEKKGGALFSDYNYAKIIIASNGLPSSEDQSEGYYRRWLIIDFPNEFPEGHDIIETISYEEYEALAAQILEILPKLLIRGSFSNQGNIEDRKKKYISISNPLVEFIDLCCYRDDAMGIVRYAELYSAYVYYLKVKKRRIVSRMEFKKTMELEGFWADKAGIEGDWCWCFKGISLLQSWKSNTAQTDRTSINPTPIPHVENGVKKKSESSVLSATELLHESNEKRLNFNKRHLSDFDCTPVESIEIERIKCPNCDLRVFSHDFDADKGICHLCGDRASNEWM